MGRLLDEEAVIDLVHKTIYEFFDICDDDFEEPMSEKDKLLLEVNKAICNALRTLPSARSEIIHCRDCKYVGIDASHCLVCKLGLKDIYVQHDDFCSYARRREDGKAD